MVVLVLVCECHATVLRHKQDNDGLVENPRPAQCEPTKAVICCDYFCYNSRAENVWSHRENPSLAWPVVISEGERVTVMGGSSGLYSD